MNQTSASIARRAYIKQLWIDILRQTTLYKNNVKLAALKAETYMVKSYTAKYVLMRLFGFPAKLVSANEDCSHAMCLTRFLQALPGDDGIFEGDVLLPDIATDAIIQSGLSISTELRSDAELDAVLEAHDAAIYLNGEKTLSGAFEKTTSGAGNKTSGAGERSAVSVDRLRTVAWSSSVYYNIDKSIGKRVFLLSIRAQTACNDQCMPLKINHARHLFLGSSDQATVAEALSEVANATNGCLKFTARPTVSEHDLADTIVFKQMPASSNTSIPS